MSVRNYAILWPNRNRTPSATAGGGNELLATDAHALDGAEHTAATGTDRLLATEEHSGLLLALSGDGNDSLRGDGTWAASGASTALSRFGGEGHALFTEDDCGATITLDLDSYNWFDLGLSEPCTISFSSTTAVAGDGHEWNIGLRGEFAVTWPAEVVWRDTDGTETTTPPDMSGAFNAITVTTLDGGLSFGAALDNGSDAASGGAGTSPSDTAGWVPLMDGVGNVVVDGATGQAVMAYVTF